MASVKVAVRVRPFNQREIDLDSKLIIQMEGKKTKILNLKGGAVKDGGSKEFTFDHSYWSFDPGDAEFAAQEQVFSDLGTEVVDSAFQGYNACVFAYGQTGSGKTFTMMGSPENQGLIPRICKSMFERMHVGKEGGASYRTEVSYLEIYNEKVKDLLQSNSSHSLRVREHPTLGPYVQSLSTHLVSDYPDIQEWMKRGNVHRTTARTNMNDTSSRSHAIFTITFVQAEFSRYHPTETVSKIHLVDLAGSERADATGATGERLKEGAHINKSLVTLGLVISSLAKLSSNPNDPTAKRNSTFIPYRDSVLTWLLKDSLGGNSKTIMIAAISPADVNYEETLSTLRYANRAKDIINKPTINEDPNVTLIRTLREEINKLKSMLGDHLPEQSVLAQLQQKEAREKALTEEWTEKWRETREILEEQSALGLRKSGVGIILDSARPHLVGIDDDLLSTGVTFYHLKDGETLIGTEDAERKQDIELSGSGIIPEHCSVVLRDGQSWLHPRPQAHCWVNTVPVDKPVRLSQGCIILLGRNNMFRFNDPAEAAVLRKSGSRSHLNLSTLSLVYSSTTDLAERTFSSENLLEDSKSVLDERDISYCMHSSPKFENGTKNEEQAQKERLAANWEQLKKKHDEYVAVINLRNAELEEKKQSLEKIIKEESIKIEKITEELEELERENITQKQYFEDVISKQIEVLQLSKESKATVLAKILEGTSSATDLLNELSLIFATLPGSADEHKSALFQSIQKFKGKINSLEDAIADKRREFGQEQSNMLKLRDAFAELVTDPIEREMSERPSAEARSRKEVLTLPLADIEQPVDSGIGSEQTEDSIADVLSPVSPDQLKKRSRGSDSSEEEGLLERQRNGLIRSKPFSKSCRAIYDEIGVGDAMRAMKSLCQKVTEQKHLIMQSLENDCSKEEINVQIAELQHLHRQYVRLEAILELRREHVLLKEQESRSRTHTHNDVFSFATNDRDCLPRLGSLARSMPILRSHTETWDSWVRIPSFVLRGVGRQARYEYEVRLFTEEEVWVLMRRYRRFRELHTSMCTKYGRQVDALRFPPRQWLPFNLESLARKRRALLETYLQELVNVCSRIRGSPLYGCGESPSRQALLQFSPFFRKGLFEPGKYGTS